jgi:type IV pilus assembly protein PilC
MEYNYTATSKDGHTVHGVMEGSDKESVIKSIKHQGMRPLIVEPKTSKVSSKLHLNFSKRVSHKELVVFTRQLSTMVAAGVPLNRSLATLQKQADGKYFKQVIADVSKNVQAGSPLGDSFAKYPDVFSSVYINMVKAGEAGGILDDILKRLANQVEKEASMRKKIKSAMTYPSVILGITVLGFFGIMIFIIPKISVILKDLGGPDAQLPIYTRMMLTTSEIMQKYLIIIILLMGVAGFLLRRYLATPAGQYQLHALMLKIPIIKTLVSKVAVARFARTFASLMSAGVGVLDALEVTGGAIGNKVIERDLKEAALEVKNGKQLSEPLSQSKHFPPIVAQMIAVGEETGKIDTILLKVADFYEEEVDALVDALSSLIEPIMIIVLGGVVGLIAASVMGPIAGLSKNIQTQ